jgi:hypothetical protein
VYFPLYFIWSLKNNFLTPSLDVHKSSNKMDIFILDPLPKFPNTEHGPFNERFLHVNLNAYSGIMRGGHAIYAQCNRSV